MSVGVVVEFEVLFREQYPRLVALGVALTGSADVANDLAQETMARAHSNWSQVNGVDSPGAWLRTVYKNLVVDHYRRQSSDRDKASRVRASGRSGWGGVVSVGDVDDAVSMVELLELLPDRQRMAVALRYVDDLTVAEIAAVLGVASGTVKASLWSARRTLERHLRSKEERS